MLKGKRALSVFWLSCYWSCGYTGWYMGLVKSGLVQLYSKPFDWLWSMKTSLTTNKVNDYFIQSTYTYRHCTRTTCYIHCLNIAMQIHRHTVELSRSAPLYSYTMLSKEGIKSTIVSLQADNSRSVRTRSLCSDFAQHTLLIRLRSYVRL